MLYSKILNLIREKEVYWGFYGSRILVCRNSKPNKSYEHL